MIQNPPPITEMVNKAEASVSCSSCSSSKAAVVVSKKVSTIKHTKKTKNNNKNNNKKVVGFSQIEIIELPYAVGDGPAAGVPVTVGWEAQDRTAFSIDFFEHFRPQRRTRMALRLSADTRSHLLLRNGYSEKEINAGAAESLKLRKDRTVTLQQISALRQLRATQKAPMLLKTTMTTTPTTTQTPTLPTRTGTKKPRTFPARSA